MNHKCRYCGIMDNAENLIVTCRMDRMTRDGMKTYRYWAHRECYYDQLREWGRKGRPRRITDPQQKRAAKAVEKAIEQGILIRPNDCPVCGLKPDPAWDLKRPLCQAHHVLGYDSLHFLDVTFCCGRCHRDLDQIVEETKAWGRVLDPYQYWLMIRRFRNGQPQILTNKIYGRQTRRKKHFA